MTRPMWHIYFRSGRFVIPSVAQAEAGFFVDVEPTQVVDVSSSAASLDLKLADALITSVRLGNPRIPSPRFDRTSVPVAALRAGVKTWATFEKTAVCWTLTDDGSRRSQSRAEPRAGRGSTIQVRPSSSQRVKATCVTLPPTSFARLLRSSVNLPPLVVAEDAMAADEVARGESVQRVRRAWSGTALAAGPSSGVSRHRGRVSVPSVRFPSDREVSNRNNVQNASQNRRCRNVISSCKAK